MNPLLKQYLESKLGPDYAQKQKSDLESAQSSARLGNLFGDLGDVVAGQRIGSTDAYFQKGVEGLKSKQSEAEKKALSEYDMEKSLQSDQAEQEKQARENDVNSPESKLAQSLAAKLGADPALVSGLTASKWKQFSPAYEKMYELEQKKVENQIKRDDLRQKRDVDAGLKAQAIAEKKQEKEQKKMSAVTEIQDRYNNIADNIQKVKDLVDEVGTQEMIGPENRIMQQYVDSIATDMAKLVDPTSVARETEVAAFRNMLFQPGFFQRESSVKAVLDNFKQMVDKRLENAYQVRGLNMAEENKKKSMSNEDRQAYDWAMANPQDKRSEAILKRLNVGAK
jgi:hypothetical protein